MIKPDRLRELLTQTIDTFKTNPEKLILQYNKGKIKSRGSKSHSFEYHYDLELIVVDFPYHPDVLFVPVLTFVRNEQFELLQNPEYQDKIEFEIDHNNHESYDIYIRLPLTERVIVKEQDGHFTATHADEPNIADTSPFSELTGYEVYLQDELIYQWKQTNE
ncbi:tail completion protein R [Mannheimia granulomatis]|uniref:Tail completion protein R n=1 Tax=Mannheimia granulomatis TaxID=85402 RepID=A0A011NBA7_9PAST|nr:phage tail protein [Mannheimia granulomatis]EXI61675.1 tail completion protein R [Mannheimia granulomatis]RGE48268.1 tail completion protein R [Mannheimia granulomatis]